MKCRSKNLEIPADSSISTGFQMSIYPILFYVSERAILACNIIIIIGYTPFGIDLYAIDEIDSCLDYFGRLLILSQQGFDNHVYEKRLPACPKFITY